MQYEEEYNGYTIRLINHRWIIVDYGDENYATWDEATRKMDNIIATLAKAAKEKLSIPVLRGDGKEFTITGIHATQGRLLGVETEGGFGGDRQRFYVPCFATRALLKQRERERAALATTEKALERLRIQYDATTTYGFHTEQRRQELNSYEGRMMRLKVAVAEAQEAATNSSQPAGRLDSDPAA